MKTSAITSLPSASLSTAATETKPSRFSVQTNWDQVKCPSGNTVLARIANAALALIVNVAKTLFNAVVWVPNKIHNLLYPNTASASAAVDDELEIEQESAVINMYNSSNEAQQATSVDEDLPEPIIQEQAGNRTWLKATAAGVALLAGTAAAAYGVEYGFPGKVPGLATGLEAVNAFFQAIPGQVTTALENAQTFACNKTGYLCKA